MPNTTFVFFDLGDTLIFRPPSEGQPYADAHSTLSTLRDRGYRLGLLSNQQSGATVAQVAQRLDGYGLGGLIERELIVISSAHPDGNITKPDERIFNYALQKAGVPGASFKTVFVTENSGHIDAARALGWRGILKEEGGCGSNPECVTDLQGLLALLPALVPDDAFEYAPPPQIVGGKTAVPVDITQIDAALTFDAADGSGVGEALLQFRVGAHGGCPIFDLRRQVNSIELDGVPLPAGAAPHHDFGGGEGAEMRLLDRALPANSTHSLRLAFDLDEPVTPSGTAVPRAFTWSAGPRLRFGFLFTDLTPGYYLEHWIPANLIFDRFTLNLEVTILNTAVPHTVISNGQVTSLGANHWSITFAASFTAFSPLLELWAADRISGDTGTVTLPVSGQTVQIEAWKPASSGLDLTTQIDLIKGYLTANENNVGAYIHGNRFVVFFGGGGMEYDGGTTSGTAPLRHELFHSWFGRGLKPCSQPDAWWDEAWTVYNDSGFPSSLPFNFSHAPVGLRPLNPWVRVTNRDAYTEGFRFFRGVAALAGSSTLLDLMSEFYRQNNAKSASTTDLEAFLLSRTGKPLVVDAFHRFVYGLANPSPAPDLWLRDEHGHAGTHLWSGRFWNSPDLWIRNRDDGGITHQAPEYGQDNWFYARVRNLSAATTAEHFMVTFNVKAFAGVEFSYPADFLPCIAAAAGFDLAPGGSTIVKARWPRELVPPPGAHACWTAAVLARYDQPQAGKHVWEHNNLAQKNLTIIDLQPNGWLVIPFVIRNLSRLARRYDLELVRPQSHPDLRATLIHSSAAIFRNVPGIIIENNPAADYALGELEPTECGGHLLQEEADVPWTSGNLTAVNARAFQRMVLAPFVPGRFSRVPVMLPRQEQILMALRLHVPVHARKGEKLCFDLVKRNVVSGRVLGGLSIEIHVN